MTPADALPWVLVLMVPVAVFLIVAVDAALEWNDRRREPEPCSPMHPCRECAQSIEAAREGVRLHRVLHDGTCTRGCSGRSHQTGKP